MNGDISVTPIAINHMTLITGSRSASDIHRKLVNMIAPKPVKRIEPKLAETFPVVGLQTD